MPRPPGPPPAKPRGDRQRIGGGTIRTHGGLRVQNEARSQWNLPHDLAQGGILGAPARIRGPLRAVVVSTGLGSATDDRRAGERKKELVRHARHRRYLPRGLTW